MDFSLFCRKIKWSLLLCFKVAALHAGGSVCFDTAGIKEPPPALRQPPETYCSSAMKQQIQQGSMKSSQLTGRCFFGKGRVVCGS